MSQDDPMSLFSQSFSKKKKKSSSEPSKLALSKSESLSKMEEPCLATSLEKGLASPLPLPENWREKIAEMSQKLNELRALGAKIPKRHNMTEHDFEAFVNNSAHFKPEDWALITSARKRTKDFVAKMKEILSKHETVKKQPKRKKEVSRSWISVD